MEFSTRFCYYNVMQKLTTDSEIFTRAVEEIVTREELNKKLLSGKKLRIKFGVDVTASTLHIGNAVNLWKMRELQEYGHKVIFLIGDFTTQIGDPTGRVEVREKAVTKNINIWANNFIKEISRILLTDKKVFEVHKNSEWFGKMKATDLANLMGFFTHSRVIERDMFQRRIKEGHEIRLTELIYPILQGYDSVMLKSDLTIIGSDQLFNENIGRFLQTKFGQPPQVIVTTVITPGLDGGSKMSKSLGNYIGLGDSPTDKFGKAMRLLDSLIAPYLETYTDVSWDEIKRIESELKSGKGRMEAKLFFAEALVGRYHGREIAQRERKEFLEMFSHHKLPDSMLGKKLRYGHWDPTVLLFNTDLVKSKTEARRLILQGAVEVDGKRLMDSKEKIVIKNGTIIRVGKRRFLRIK